MGIEQMEKPAPIRQLLSDRSITNLMFMIWQSRPDLQSAFNLDILDGQQNFCHWYDVSALREYGIFPQRLNGLDPSSDIPQLLDGKSITNLMYLIWQSREDLQHNFDLQTSRGQLAFYEWCDVSVFREYGIELNKPERTSDRAAIKFQHDFQPSWSTPLHRYLIGLEIYLRKIAKYFPVSVRKYGKVIWYRLSVLAAGLATRFFEARNSRSFAILPKRLAPLTPAPQGANLIGYVHAELGMGEHVRMTASALATTDFKFNVMNFDVGVASRQKATLEHGTIATSNIYRTNLFHINADAMLLAYCHFGKNFFSNRYNIGYWAWELAKCPEEWVLVMDMVEEIWAPSRFIQSAFAEKTNKPVEYMPLCVSLPLIPNYERSYFGLPSNTFLFLFTFDFFSYIDRKNPFAVIESFLTAFPDRIAPAVGLVIKVMNGDYRNPQWQRMLQMVENDPRVFIFNNTMNREEILGLFNVCDSFVSLHRSEGFGRGPAEAMYYGKPVIVTNYSGNTDFTHSSNSCLVDYKLIPVEKGQYVFESGQVWADPDIDHAAWYMRKLVNDNQYANDIGLKGRDFILQNFSPSVIGEMYKKRLQAIYKK